MSLLSMVVCIGNARGSALGMQGGPFVELRSTVTSTSSTVKDF